MCPVSVLQTENVFPCPVSIVGNESVKVNLAADGQKTKLVLILLIQESWNKATVSFIFFPSNGSVISIICQKTIFKIKVYISASITGTPKWELIARALRSLGPDDRGKGIPWGEQNRLWSTGHSPEGGSTVRAMYLNPQPISLLCPEHLYP